MEPRIDEMVLVVQKWLNTTYGNDSRFNKVEENGKTGWDTIYGLRRALQIEIDLPEGSDSFGPQTYENCPNINWGEESNLVFIVQGGLWCKGYSPGGFTGYYGDGTYAAVQQLKADMGFPTASGNMNRDIMKGLLDMSAFVCLESQGGTEEIRSIQQKLNYDYYDYYQICPCDGLYNREMNKMLIYALQKELGITKNNATGTWGPTTTSLCKAKTYSIGDSSNIIQLVRYATVCNGFSVNTNSSVYDKTLDNVLKRFCNLLNINKSSNIINYTVIKSLLSSNGNTDRSALACDTATKLTNAQITTIKNAGFKYVGRYISNTPGGSLDKALTIDEIERILDSGLKIFYIFQESNNDPSVFTEQKGQEQASRAKAALEDLNVPIGATIYFAVDCDPLDAEIDSYIIPYFKAVYSAMNYGIYRVGVYGTRNVCQKIRDEFGGRILLFVSDASYGFSGNLGFKMPDDWAFDQFATDIEIGSGNGAVAIDKVSYSGVDDCIYEEITTNVKTIRVPTNDEKKHQGILYVNIHDKPIRIYKRLWTIPMAGSYFDYPSDDAYVYTLPKYAMYLNIGKCIEDDVYPRGCVHLIKYLNEETGKIEYGYLPVRKTVYDGATSTFEYDFSDEIMETIEGYDNQREFINYQVDVENNQLYPTEWTEIDGEQCACYLLKNPVKVYDASGEYRFDLSADSFIAIRSAYTGQTYNHLIRAYKKFDVLKGEWEEIIPPVIQTNPAYIEYRLEDGSMPNSRVLYNK